MKMPEPIGYLHAVEGNYFPTPQRNTKDFHHKHRYDTPLYDKQALIDLLEAAAVECDQERVAHLMFKNYQAAMALANVADSIRSMEETL